MTTGTGQLLDRRYGIKSPPTLISRCAGSEPVAFNSLHVGTPQLTLKSVPGETAYALQFNRLPSSTFDVKIGGAHAPQRHTIGKSSFCLWDLTTPPGASFHDGFSTIRLHLPFAALREFAASIGARNSALKRMQPGTNDPILHHLFSCLSPAFQSPEDANPLFVDHIAMALQLHLLQHYGGGIALSMGRGGLAGWQVRRAQGAMAANLGGGFSLNDLARDCGLSTSHFSRAFRESTGLPPHRWFTRRRIDTAKDLLLSSSLSLPEIALASGFSDQSHLTRAFTRAVGTSPAAWRRAHDSSAPFNV